MDEHVPSKLFIQKRNLKPGYKKAIPKIGMAL